MIVKNYLCNVSRKFLIKIESMWRREIKEQIPQITLLYRDRTVRRSHRSCSIRKLFLRISQCPHEAPVFESIFKKVADLPALLKRDTNTEKIFNTNFFEKTSAKGCFLLFSMVHCYMDLKV